MFFVCKHQSFVEVATKASLGADQEQEGVGGRFRPVTWMELQEIRAGGRDIVEHHPLLADEAH